MPPSAACPSFMGRVTAYRRFPLVKGFCAMGAQKL